VPEEVREDGFGLFISKKILKDKEKPHKIYTTYKEILYLCPTHYRGLVVLWSTLLTHKLKARNHDYLSMSR
jgi:hypothetical protein